jgi:hypothetical protein
MIRPAIAIAFFVFLAAPAEAAPRDEAMARAYHCAAHPATRVWLDCYYGAAQPVRAALGMSPAPAAQAQLSEASPGTELPADVALRNAAMAEAARCAGVAQDRLWLDCFYAASNPVRAALMLAPLSGPAVAVPRQPSLAPPPQPGLPRRAKGGILTAIFGQTMIEAQGRMASYSFDAHDSFTITLDNGQTWRQLDDDSSHARWRKPANTYLVTISSGALGSHNLTVKDSPGMFKVKRVS